MDKLTFKGQGYKDISDSPSFYEHGCLDCDKTWGGREQRKDHNSAVLNKEKV